MYPSAKVPELLMKLNAAEAITILAEYYQFREKKSKLFRDLPLKQSRLRNATKFLLSTRFGISAPKEQEVMLVPQLMVDDSIVRGIVEYQRHNIQFYPRWCKNMRILHSLRFFYYHEKKTDLSPETETILVEIYKWITGQLVSDEEMVIGRQDKKCRVA